MNNFLTLCTGKKVIIDADDFYLLSKFKLWELRGYGAITLKINGKKKNLLLHRYIMDKHGFAISNKQIDHINGNPLDNRKINLRIVTDAENKQNKYKARSSSRTGIRGVMFEPKNKNKYRVRIWLNGKGKSFGYFSNLEMAEKAAIKARQEYMPFSNI